MRYTLQAGTVLLASAGVLGQNVTIPAVDGSLPAAGSNGCAAGYYPGSDTVIYTVPYTYQQVLSIIGNYTNLTWSGSPDNSVTTNNSAALASNDWTPGTARFYDVAGAHVIETITTYSKPAAGPYVEIHTLAPLTVPSYNVSFYGDFDGQVWKPICNGGATWTNFTINFCATNATVAAAVLHGLHMTDAVTVGKFLGGNNFTSCAMVEGGNGTARPSMFPGGNGTMSMSAASTGAASMATGVGSSSTAAATATGVGSSGTAGATATGAASTTSSGGSSTSSAPATSANTAQKTTIDRFAASVIALLVLGLGAMM